MLLRDYIRICCIRKSTALAEVARKAGMSAQNLSNKMSRNKFTNDDLEKIAAALDTKLEIRFYDPATNQYLEE